jgi:pentatricopeptide repeat protein
MVDFDVFVRSIFGDMYAKHGSIDDAWMLFNMMPSQNVGTWKP